MNRRIKAKKEKKVIRDLSKIVILTDVFFSENGKEVLKKLNLNTLIDKDNAIIMGIRYILDCHTGLIYDKISKYNRKLT